MPWFEPPSPTKAMATPPVLRVLGGQRGTADQRGPAAHDAVGAHHAVAEVGDVHRAALAAAEAILPAEDLVHHAAHIAALGDAVAVPAMGRGDPVIVVEVHAKADGGRLLAGVEMHESRDVARGELVVHPLLEIANRAHPTIGREQILATELHISLPDGSAPRAKVAVAHWLS